MSNLPFERISSYRSRFSRFNTNQYVNNFLITELGEYPQYELYQIFNTIIDESFSDAEADYGRRPYMYNVIMLSDTLDTPISLNLYHHDGDTDLDLVNLFCKNYIFII